MVTPPVGLNLFVTSGVTGMSLVEVTKAALLIITYVPVISVGLPDLVFGKA
jgi:C4-dicarboxylate transporter DctM subunit